MILVRVLFFQLLFNPWSGDKAEDNQSDCKENSR